MGEVETIEALMNFRVSKENIWKDIQTDQPLYRINSKAEPMQAARDEDITLSPFNAGTIMDGYLTKPDSLPRTNPRSEALTALVNNSTWNKLLTLAKNYRISLGRIAKD